MSLTNLINSTYEFENPENNILPLISSKSDTTEEKEVVYLECVDLLKTFAPFNDLELASRKLSDAYRKRLNEEPKRVWNDIKPAYLKGREGLLECYQKVKQSPYTLQQKLEASNVIAEHEGILNLARRLFDENYQVQPILHEKKGKYSNYLFVFNGSMIK